MTNDHSKQDATRADLEDFHQRAGLEAMPLWQRCSHHSLLLSQLGLLPDPEPVVADIVIIEQPAPCRSCRGEGFVRASVGGHLADWVAVPCSCT